MKGRDYYRFIRFLHFTSPTSRWRYEMIPRRILIRVCPLEAIFLERRKSACFPKIAMHSCLPLHKGILVRVVFMLTAD